MQVIRAASTDPSTDAGELPLCYTRARVNYLGPAHPNCELRSHECVEATAATECFHFRNGDPRAAVTEPLASCRV